MYEYLDRIKLKNKIGCIRILMRPRLYNISFRSYTSFY